MVKKISSIVITIIMINFFVLTSVIFVYAQNQNPEIPEIPQVTIRFAHAPYVDHTDASIAIEKGWFQDVGITLEDPEWNVTFDKIPSVLAAGTIDIGSSNLYGLIPAMAQAKNLRMYAYGDLFIGFAIMAQPGYKTYIEFRSEGLTPEEALKNTLKQMIGKRVALSPSPPDRSFLSEALTSAGYGLQDMQVITVEDPVGIAMMEANRADFQMGGAPARSTLESRGYVPIFTNIDFIEKASLGETRGIHHNGWATTIEYWEKNRETLLRVASVKWRIMKYIYENPKEALEIHLPFLEKISGHQMTFDEGKVVYDSLDPFFTFESQWEWYFDENNPFYEKYPIRAAIESFEGSGVLPVGSITEDEVSIAKEVYEAALEYKSKSDQEFLIAHSKIRLAEIQGKNTLKAKELLEQAKYFYEIYDYLDSYRFAQASTMWAEF